MRWRVNWNFVWGLLVACITGDHSCDLLHWTWRLEVQREGAVRGWCQYSFVLHLPVYSYLCTSYIGCGCSYSGLVHNIDSICGVSEHDGWGTYIFCLN